MENLETIKWRNDKSDLINFCRNKSYRRQQHPWKEYVQTLHPLHKKIPWDILIIVFSNFNVHTYHQESC
jgi:hypothetical protein